MHSLRSDICRTSSLPAFSPTLNSLWKGERRSSWKCFERMQMEATCTKPVKDCISAPFARSLQQPMLGAGRGTAVGERRDCEMSQRRAGTRHFKLFWKGSECFPWAVCSCDGRKLVCTPGMQHPTNRSADFGAAHIETAPTCSNKGQVWWINGFTRLSLTLLG